MINKIDVFDSLTVVKTDGNKITYREGYKRAGDFWDIRNITMAKNILTMTQKFQGKKIVVLNGFFHRYYLKSILSEKEEEYNFKLVEPEIFYHN